MKEQHREELHMSPSCADYCSLAAQQAVVNLQLDLSIHFRYQTGFRSLYGPEEDILPLKGHQWPGKVVQVPLPLATHYEEERHIQWT